MSSNITSDETDGVHGMVGWDERFHIEIESVTRLANSARASAIQTELAGITEVPIFEPVQKPEVAVTLQAVSGTGYGKGFSQFC
jgi:hypothetical protein